MRDSTLYYNTVPPLTWPLAAAGRNPSGPTLLSLQRTSTATATRCPACPLHCPPPWFFLQLLGESCPPVPCCPPSLSRVWCRMEGCRREGGFCICMLQDCSCSGLCHSLQLPFPSTSPLMQASALSQQLLPLTWSSSNCSYHRWAVYSYTGTYLDSDLEQWLWRVWPGVVTLTCRCDSGWELWLWLCDVLCHCEPLTWNLHEMPDMQVA